MSVPYEIEPGVSSKSLSEESLEKALTQITEFLSTREEKLSIRPTCVLLKPATTDLLSEIPKVE